MSIAATLTSSTSWFTSSFRERLARWRCAGRRWECPSSAESALVSRSRFTVGGAPVAPRCDETFLKVLGVCSELGQILGRETLVVEETGRPVAAFAQRLAAGFDDHSVAAHTLLGGELIQLLEQGRGKVGGRIRTKGLGVERGSRRRCPRPRRAAPRRGGHRSKRPGAPNARARRAVPPENATRDRSTSSKALLC